MHAGRYVPRAILMDLEPGTMDSVRSGPYGQVSFAACSPTAALLLHSCILSQACHACMHVGGRMDAAPMHAAMQ